MRRLVRRLFTLCSAVSLLLCLLTCVLWVRSYSHLTAIIAVRTPSYLYGVSVVRGGVYLVRTDAPASGVQPRLVSVPLREDVEYMTVPHQLAGFGYMRAAEGYPALRLPAWLVVLLLAATALPTPWARFRRHRRSHAGLCPACAYDLRASPGRCPECGTVTARIGTT